MIGIVKLLHAALDRDRPAVDQLLPRPLLRRQFHLLQRIANRAVILIMGDMFDAQSHSHSTTRTTRSIYRAPAALRRSKWVIHPCSPPSPITPIGPQSRSPP